jgi:hypothetical protein
MVLRHKELIVTDLLQLNGYNGAGKRCLEVCQQLKDNVTDHKLFGAELGVAYGGGPQAIGRLWKPVGGMVYGFDTFEGHPKQLSCTPTAMEYYCMDHWYRQYGTENLSVAYQRKALAEEGLSNVVLIPGLLNEKSLDVVPYLDYCLMDLDLIAAMVLAWRLVSTRMHKGGFLCIHDVLPLGHITGLWGLYKEIMASCDYDLVGEYPENLLVVLRRK